ncbi:MAG: PAS domain S-box protein [Candidatus Aminicenantes bacterium]|nr:PAS domain S-box protein [Candidatus Aminicenantes bacterium]
MEERKKSRKQNPEKSRMVINQGENFIHECESLYKELLLTSEDSIVVTDLEGKILNISHGTMKLFQYKNPEELIGQSGFILMLPSERKKMAEKLRETIKTGSIKNQEAAWQRKDGSVFIGESNGSVIRDSSGKPKGIISITREITYRYQYEKVQKVLFNITRSTNISVNLDALLKNIYRELGTLIDTTNFFIALYDKKKDTYTFPFYVDAYDKFEEFEPKRLKKSLTDYVRRTGKPLLADGDVLSELEREGEIDLIGTPCQIWLGVPLKSGEEVIGVVTVQSYTNSKAYTGQDLQLLNYVSNHVAIAIERKKSEDALRESEERFRKMAANIQEGLAIIEDDKVVFVNERLCEIYGYNPDEMKQFSSFNLAAPEERIRLKAAAEHVKKTGRLPKEIQFWIIRKDGNRRYVRNSYSTSHNGGGVTSRYLIVSDITEQQKTEEALKSSEEKFRLMFEKATDAIIWTDVKTGKIINCNRSVKDLFGYTKKEILGKNQTSLHPSEEKEKYEKLYHSYITHKQKVNQEVEVITKDRKRKTVLISASLIEMNESQIMQIIFRDISRRKQTEEQLKESETKYSTLVENSMDAVVIIKNGLIKFANKQAEVISGYSHSQIKNMPLEKLIAPEFMELMLTRHEERLKGKKVPPFYEALIVRKDGKKIDVEISATMIPFEGGKAVMAVVRDITSRKRAEAELKKSYEKLQRSMESTISAIARMVELKDPYTSGHQQRVAELSCTIARKMGMTENRITGLHMAAIIHDIGKLYIPAEILSRPSKLSESEFQLIKDHPTIAYKILKPIESQWNVAEIVYQHHERIDGSGYPRGLKNDEILLEARILGLADLVDAMSSHRPYRPSHSINRTLDEVIRNRGILFDTKVVDICVRLFREEKFKLSYND